MNINIQSVHFTARQPLLDLIHEKVGKLFDHHSEVEFGDVFLKLDKSDTHHNKVCEIKLRIPGNELIAKKNCETFEEAVALTVKALETQLTKSATKNEL
ncbi:MAG TPA: HPF/RaiA family ribosome-associated protein [Bacteroidia bacterium]|jgi:putative sigma-54 modulation protein|nr:HPF/RaiA family ribosome-associated protein [Bacteroidia bacterium]